MNFTTKPHRISVVLKYRMMKLYWHLKNITKYIQSMDITKLLLCKDKEEIVQQTWHTGCFNGINWMNRKRNN